ncbi:MAG: alpha/beta hydrolase [Candidatus Kapabacteria bacterium]|nr:alpha/beta hydrolase [Candidatus Kapabacteria bacterium]
MHFIDGKYISSGNKNLYVRISGKGEPAVVIEPGWGVLSVEWSLIQEKLAEITTVISYDRAGYGESPENIKPRTGQQISSEIFTMLRNSGVPEPYIFMGHSSGGLYVINLLKMFPRMASGVIFVDSFTPNLNELEDFDFELYQKYFTMKSRVEGIKNILELDDESFSKYMDNFLNNLYSFFPNEIQSQLLVYQKDKKFYRTICDEYEGLKETVENIKKIDFFPNIPIKILSRDNEVMIETFKQLGLPKEKAEQLENLWQHHQKSLLDLSNLSEIKIIKGSNHMMHITNPDEIIEEARNLIEEERKNEVTFIY